MIIGTIGFIFGSISGIIIGYGIGKKKNSIQIGGDNCTQIQIETSELANANEIKQISDKNKKEREQKARKEFFELVNRSIKKRAEDGDSHWWLGISAQNLIIDAGFTKQELIDYFIPQGYKLSWEKDSVAACTLESIRWGE